ncbi:hypothetical protein J3D48_006291 [Pseudomonas fluorescens]|nr:hypothetical protein [Pseudomonas fluorescens]
MKSEFRLFMAQSFCRPPERDSAFVQRRAFLSRIVREDCRMEGRWVHGKVFAMACFFEIEPQAHGLPRATGHGRTDAPSSGLSG